MTFKLLHTGDWHGDKSTAGLPRFDDVRQAVRQSVDYAIANEVDAYLFTGDLADPDGGAIVLRCLEVAVEAAQKLAGEGIASYWMPGNHDVAEDGHGTTTLSPMRAITSDWIYLAEEPTTFEMEDPRVLLSCLPYPSFSTAYDPATRMAGRFEEWEGRRVVVAGHMTQLEGVVPGEETNEMPRGRGIPFPVEQCDPSWLLLNGHWHDRQVAKVAGRSIHICGALARLTFGEERNAPSFTIHEVV